MMESTETADRSAVRDRLDRVNDPELDESIVELKYIDQVRIEGTAITVRFRLPTAWCSPAFAWMMATGIRDEVSALSAVEDVRVRLIDHMHNEKINHGVNQRLAFEEVFEDAESDVEAVRHELDRKARIARQYQAMSVLFDEGVQSDQIARLTRSDITFREGGDDDDRQAIVALQGGALYITVAAEPIEGYLEKAEQTAVVEQPDEELFKTPEGDSIDTEDVEQVYARTRLAKSNMNGQGGICAELNESRYDDVAAETAD